MNNLLNSAVSLWIFSAIFIVLAKSCIDDNECEWLCVNNECANYAQSLATGRRVSAYNPKTYTSRNLHMDVPSQMAVTWPTCTQAQKIIVGEILLPWTFQTLAHYKSGIANQNIPELISKFLRDAEEIQRAVTTNSNSVGWIRTPQGKLANKCLAEDYSAVLQNIGQDGGIALNYPNGMSEAKFGTVVGKQVQALQTRKFTYNEATQRVNYIVGEIASIDGYAFSIHQLPETHEYPNIFESIATWRGGSASNDVNALLAKLRLDSEAVFRLNKVEGTTFCDSTNTQFAVPKEGLAEDFQKLGEFLDSDALEAIRKIKDPLTNKQNDLKEFVNAMFAELSAKTFSRYDKIREVAREVVQAVTRHIDG